MHRIPRRFALLASVVVLALPGCSSSSSASSSGASGSSGPASTAGAHIVISNFSFQPTNLTVAPGAKVSVTNDDSVTHTVTATTGKAFDTGDIPSKQTVQFTAPTTAGSYPYACTIHPFMHGALTVR